MKMEREGTTLLDVEEASETLLALSLDIQALMSRQQVPINRINESLSVLPKFVLSIPLCYS